MPSGPIGLDPSDESKRSAHETSVRADIDTALSYLEIELRQARSAAIRAGADSCAVTADLEQRLRRIRQMLTKDDDDPAYNNE
jgi:hypothetical protein